jgi:predicted metal-dependent HD superfamily phosphohydrolase
MGDELAVKRRLKERWEQLYKQLSKERCVDKPACSARWWACILDHHCEPSRRYHTCVHLHDMFRYLDRYQTKLERPDLVSLAIFFHCIIYDGHPHQDKEKSATELTKFGEEIQLSNEDIKTVAEWIIRTADHKCPRKDPDCGYFLDIVLSILGKPWDAYDKYVCQISEEQRLLRKMSPLIWQVVFPFLRSCSMAPLLNTDRGPIYSTAEFQQTLEEQAQINLSRELKHWVYRSTMLIVAVVVVLSIPIGIELAYPPPPGQSRLDLA